MSPLAIAEFIVFLAAAYAICGTAFAIVFLAVGVQRVDLNAASAGFGVRLLWLPGTAALWPLLAKRWLRGSGIPDERNAHRDTVTKGAAS